MISQKELIESIFNISDLQSFEKAALSVFNLQYNETIPYREFSDLIGKNPSNVSSLTDLPFLPISVFKKRMVIRGSQNVQLQFLSSGTGKTAERSVHYVTDADVYKKSLLNSFCTFVGNPAEYSMLSLLPGYVENPDSSLIYMLEELGKYGLNKKVLDFAGNGEKLGDELAEVNHKKMKSILFGVTFALIDFAISCDIKLPHSTIIETGGMKGSRKEITREEVHQIIRKRLEPERIISEYGMTELLSQAYAIFGGKFISPPWMRVLVREVNDALSVSAKGEGALNIIDLANINSCSFLATDDLGRVDDSGQFDVLGRSDHSEVRGCNLLYAD